MLGRKLSDLGLEVSVAMSLNEGMRGMHNSARFYTDSDLVPRNFGTSSVQSIDDGF